MEVDHMGLVSLSSSWTLSKSLCKVYYPRAGLEREKGHLAFEMHETDLV